MFDDTSSRDDDGDDRFEALIDAANAALSVASEEEIGWAEEDLIGDKCDDTFMTVDEVVAYIRGDRASRKELGIPHTAM